MNPPTVQPKIVKQIWENKFVDLELLLSSGNNKKTSTELNIKNVPIEECFVQLRVCVPKSNAGSNSIHETYR